MFDNLFAVAFIIAILWVIVFGFYLYTSRHQKSIAEEIDIIQKKLDEKTEES